MSPPHDQARATLIARLDEFGRCLVETQIVLRGWIRVEQAEIATMRAMAVAEGWVDLVAAFDALHEKTREILARPAITL